jgi:hypothetical protein
MRFLRKIEGKTRRDRIRNKIIRETVGVEPIQEYVERYQRSNMERGGKDSKG